MTTRGRTLRLPVPCHIITGSLASGKTSLILHLLRQKPEHEVWAVLVNELGAVGIDQAVLAAAGGAVVRELAGGCLCCAMSHVTGAALAQLLRSAKPDRLIIEPSGLAHPKALLQLLRGPHLRSALAVQPLACLVDLSRFAASNRRTLYDGPVHAEQLEVAGIIVGSKADACGSDTLAMFLQWGEALSPRRRVLTCSNSELSAELLGLTQCRTDPRPVTEGQAAALPTGGRPTRLGAPASPWAETDGEVGIASTASEPEPGRPRRREGRQADGGAVTCGWVFHRSDVFSRQRALAWLAAAAPHVLRIKGILRLAEDEWVAVSAGVAPPGVSCTPTAHRQDSRLEIICSGVDIDMAPGQHGNQGAAPDALALALASQDWAAVEQALLALLQK